MTEESVTTGGTTTTTSTSTATSKVGGGIGDDNFLGAYCHLPVIGGVLVPIIVYLLKKDENPELGFQAKQAIVFQLVGSVLFFVLAFVAGFGGVFLAATMGDIGGLFMLLIWGIYGITALVFLVIALMAAWKTYNKEHYKYPVIGGML